MFCISVFLSLPSIIRLPRLLPFAKAEVRAAITPAMQELRNQGLWLVNVDIEKIERQDEEICFIWNHEYRSREKVYPEELITTCVNAP